MRLDVLLCPECLQPSPLHNDSCGRPGHEVVKMMPVFEHDNEVEQLRDRIAALDGGVVEDDGVVTYYQ